MKKCPVDGYAARIRRCSAARDISAGKTIHQELRSLKMDEHKFLGNLLVQMYGSWGHTMDAQAAFHATVGKNIFSWNIFMSVHIRAGHLLQASKTYKKMPLWDVVSWNAIHGAYAKVGNIESAEMIFCSMQDPDVMAWNTMLGLYAQKRQIDKCKKMFDDMPIRDEVSWNSLLVGYLILKQIDIAMVVFHRTPSRNVVHWNTVVTALLEDGDVARASLMYKDMPEKDIVSWTAFIIAYARHGDMSKAKTMMLKMPLLDEISLAAIITVYSQRGDMEEARDIFSRTASDHVSAWNAMIVGYAQNGQSRKALAMFGLMDQEGISFNKVTFFSVFDACIGLVGLGEGRALHGVAVDSGLLFEEVEVGNALITMYGKFGSLDEAKAVFEDIPHQRTLVSWNSLAMSYTNNGEGKMAVDLYHYLLAEGEQPDDITFLTMLTACSRDGLLEEGVECFRSIVEHEMTASLDHFMCMVDLLGRVGKLARAEDLMESMPFEPREAGWRSLLAACRVHNDVQRGARLQNRVTNDSGSFSLLSNIYSAR